MTCHPGAQSIFERKLHAAGPLEVDSPGLLVYGMATGSSASVPSGSSSFEELAPKTYKAGRFGKEGTQGWFLVWRVDIPNTPNLCQPLIVSFTTWANGPST